jgi:2'-5' RNA ligase
VRLFVALFISAAVRQELAMVLRGMRSISPEARDASPRWVPPGSLHVTLKFIGEAAPERLAGIAQGLAAVRFPAPLALTFRGMGFFPDEKRPAVLWAGIQASSALAELAAQIESSLEEIGFPREPRAFAPHLTLARFKGPDLRENLRAAIRQNAERDFGSCATQEFHLVESKLKSAGAEYTTVQSFRFTTAEG